MLNWDAVKRHALTSRTLFFASAMLTGVFEILAWIADPPSGWLGVVVAIIFVMAVFALPFGGRYAVWVLVLVVCLDEVSPGFEAMDETLGLGLGMLLLGYISHHWSDILAGALIVMSSAYDMYYFPEDAGLVFPQGVFGMALSYGIVYCCGVVLWQRRMLRRERQIRERLETRQRDIAVAARIHEAVSGNLARILLEEQRLSLQDGGDGKSRSGLRAIHDDAEQALQDVHAVIDYLDGGDKPEATSLPAVSCAEALTSVMHSGDRRLRSLGFQGSSDIRGACAVPMDDRCELFLEMLREAYTNIEKHAAYEGYRIAVMMRDDRLILSQTNPLPHHDERRNEPLSSGRGLALLSKLVHRHGGEMRWTKEKDGWSLFCSLPLADGEADNRKWNDTRRIDDCR